MSEFKASGFRDEFGSGGPDLVGITTMTSPYYFVPPSGSTAERPQSPPPGMLRFNTDIGRLEVWRNDHWGTILGESPDLGDQNNTDSSGGTGVRGCFGGGAVTPGGADDRETNNISYITISTLGNAHNFGDLTLRRDFIGAAGSRTRGFWAAGVNPGNAGYNRVDTIVFASEGDATDFGDTTNASQRPNDGASNQTRALFSGINVSNVIEYFTMATTGTLVDFGDLNGARTGGASANSSVRGFFMGASDPALTNSMEYVTFSTTGNGQDFGDLTDAREFMSAASSATRAVIGGGGDPANLNVVDFFNMATLGDAQDFGDLSVARDQVACSSSTTRGVWYGGFNFQSTMDYVTIQTTGNALDFGDTGENVRGAAGTSNGHGGL